MLLHMLYEKILHVISIEESLVIYTPVYPYSLICTRFQPLIANHNEHIHVSFSKHNEEFSVMNHECPSMVFYESKV